ncbi:hypothetical protein BC829DRAFT_67874 [Chytridium lagenaria]|nr:hypothetical protein BC829DRAFT_67874 [Chytridium lagenaria]
MEYGCGSVHFGGYQEGSRGIQGYIPTLLPLLFNQALLSSHTGDDATSIHLLTSILSPPSPPLIPHLRAFAYYLLGISHSSTSPQLALTNFHASESLLPSPSISLEPYGISFNLHLYEIKFNAAVCLWRMGSIDEAAQELADARPDAVSEAHVEAFDEVMRAGFDPPGLFFVPEDALFAFPDDVNVGWVIPNPDDMTTASVKRMDEVTKPLPPIEFDQESVASTEETCSIDDNRSSYYDNRISEVPPVPLSLCTSSQSINVKKLPHPHLWSLLSRRRRPPHLSHAFKNS